MDLQLQKPLENLHMAFNIGQLDTLNTDLKSWTQDSPLDKLCPKDLFYLQLLLAVCRLFQLA